MVHWLDEVPEYNTSPLIPLCFVTALSSYGLYMAYQNITRLQEYEDQAQKLSKWSKVVAARLNKTRTTQTSGTIAVRVESPFFPSIR
jgi:7-keto-8-aminopelargonate synthetase-like enzyme